MRIFNVFRAVNSIQEDLISENEKAVADWVFRNNKHAGATTDTVPSDVAQYPMQTVFLFSRCGAEFGNKKSPHNNLNLTIPSGMALVRVRYVAIRKSKTCSGSFGSRAGTLNKYVILNCWDRLPQKSQCVNVNLSGQGPSILLRKTVLSLKSPTGAFIAPLRYANANF